MAYDKEAALHDVSLLLKNTPGLEEIPVTDYDGVQTGDFAYYHCRE